MGGPSRFIYSQVGGCGELLTRLKREGRDDSLYLLTSRSLEVNVSSYHVSFCFPIIIQNSGQERILGFSLNNTQEIQYTIHKKYHPFCCVAKRMDLFSRQ